jgi:DMSO/TMAO reductase YedYZ molybdopterin-dependent catalytic subunit
MSDLRTHDVPDGVDPSDWSLRVTGAVAEPLRIDREDLASFPVETVTEDFSCVEGWVAAGLSWQGVRVSAVLDRAGPTVDDGYVLVHAMDGDYACSVPRDRAADALLAVELDGEPLAVTHGGPARFVPTDGGADCWESVKWVTELDVRASKPVAGDTAEEIALDRVG